ncbi:hypothetical protein CCACVL1_09234, partial [Corchorus capsularis]
MANAVFKTKNCSELSLGDSPVVESLGLQPEVLGSNPGTGGVGLGMDE